MVESKHPSCASESSLDLISDKEYGKHVADFAQSFEETGTWRQHSPVTLYRLDEKCCCILRRNNRFGNATFEVSKGNGFSNLAIRAEGPSLRGRVRYMSDSTAHSSTPTKH